MLEPINLTSIKGVVEGDLESLATLLLNLQSELLSWSKAGKTKNGDLIRWGDQVVIAWFGKSEWKHTLLLQVGF